MKKITDKICLVPNCGKLANAGRGLCKNHYPVAFRLVRTGKTTWTKLEKTGKTMPSNVQYVTNWFLDLKEKVK